MSDQRVDKDLVYQPVIFNDATKRFDNVEMQTAKRVVHVAPEGWYITLKNPAKDDAQPLPGTLAPFLV